MAKQQTVLHCGLIFIVTAISYAGVLGHQFVWDTIPFVIENPWVHELSAANLQAMFTESFRANWHPLVLLSHAIDISIFGLNPGPHHVINVGYHVINAWLVYWLVSLILERAHFTAGSISWTACLTALIFAVHPQHVESVAWVVERKDVLYSLFTLACFISYLKADQPGIRRHLLPFVWFCLALMSKPMAVTIPAILVLLDIFPRQSVNDIKALVRSILEKSHYWLAAIVVAAITLQTQAMAMPDEASLPLLYRALNAVNNSVFYLGHYIWPVNLSPFYPYPSTASEMLQPAFWLPGTLFLTATICLGLWLLTRHVRSPLVLIGFYLVTLLPASGLIHVGPAKATDHFSYLATLPVSLLTAIAIIYVYKGWLHARLLTLTFASLYILFLIAITIPQVSHWRDPLSLWGRVVTLYPESAFAHRNIAAAYVEIGELDQALFHAEKSLALGSPDVQYVERLRQYVDRRP